MDEWVDIVDRSGQRTGKAVLKSDAHREGYLHPTVHIWCYAEDGLVLLQKRGAFKTTFPLMWDVSVAGHIGAGEEPIAAALREIKEEIGISVQAAQLQKMGLFQEMHRHENGIIDAELHHIYILKLDSKTTDLKLQPEELEALEWWDLEKLKQAVRNRIGKENIVPHELSYYEAVIRAIEAG